jgi:uncharacterized membrane protein
VGLQRILTVYEKRSLKLTGDLDVFGSCADGMRLPRSSHSGSSSKLSVKNQVTSACAETQPFSETAFVRIVDIGI